MHPGCCAAQSASDLAQSHRSLHRGEAVHAHLSHTCRATLSMSGAVSLTKVLAGTLAAFPAAYAVVEFEHWVCCCCMLRRWSEYLHARFCSLLAHEHPPRALAGLWRPWVEGRPAHAGRQVEGGREDQAAKHGTGEEPRNTDSPARRAKLLLACILCSSWGRARFLSLAWLSASALARACLQPDHAVSTGGWHALRTARAHRTARFCSTPSGAVCHQACATRSS